MCLNPQGPHLKGPTPRLQPLGWGGVFEAMIIQYSYVHAEDSLTGLWPNQALRLPQWVLGALGEIRHHCILLFLRLLLLRVDLHVGRVGLDGAEALLGAEVLLPDCSLKWHRTEPYLSFLVVDFYGFAGFRLCLDTCVYICMCFDCINMRIWEWLCVCVCLEFCDKRMCSNITYFRM
jgi:hypothetical protein